LARVLTVLHYHCTVCATAVASSSTSRLNIGLECSQISEEITVTVAVSINDALPT